MTLDELIDALKKKRNDLENGSMKVEIRIRSFTGNIFADRRRTELELENFSVESFMDGEVVVLEGGGTEMRVKVTVEGPSYKNEFDAPLDTSSLTSREWLAFVRNLRLAVNHAKQIDAVFQQQEREESEEKERLEVVRVIEEAK